MAVPPVAVRVPLLVMESTVLPPVTMMPVFAMIVPWLATPPVTEDGPPTKVLCTPPELVFFPVSLRRMPTPLAALIVPVLLLVMPLATVEPLSAMPAYPVPVLVIDPMLVTPPLTLAGPALKIAGVVPFRLIS